MKFVCDQCSAQYMIADEKVGVRGVKVKCKKCGHIIIVKPAEQAPAPAASVESAAAPMGSALGAAKEPNAFSGFGAPFAGAAPAAAPATGADNWQSNALGGAAMQADLSALAGSAAAAGPSSAGQFDLGALGTAESAAPPAAAAAAAPRKKGDKVWYVAIEDTQVGPVDVGEIEQRWDGFEITEDSLVWKTGMADWSPIAEVPDLAYLVTEKPQQKKAAASVAAPAAASPRAAASPAASFGAAPMGNEVSDGGWKPSAASALSSLAQDELVASAAPKVEAAPANPGGLPELGMPSFGANDLFGSAPSGGAGPSPAPMGGGRTDPFGGGMPQWSVPARRPTSSSGGIKPIHLLVGGMFMLIIVLLVGVVVFMLRPGFIGPQPRQPDRTYADGRNPTPNSAQPAVPSGPAAVPAVPTPTQPVAGENPRPTKAGRHPKNQPGEAGEAPKPGKPKEDLDDLFAGGKKPPAAEKKASLTKEDIIGVVKKQAGSLGKCIVTAKNSGDLTPGPIKFLLDWTINPDGSVSNPRLKGPPNVLSTSLPQCFAQAMGRWEFPASTGGAPIANFPLPTTIP